MIVKLPSRLPGRKIVEAFKAAAAIEVGISRWRPEEFVSEYQYECGSVKKAPRVVGIHAYPLHLRPEWVFFGKAVWKNGTERIKLEGVKLDDHYKEVNVEAQVFHGYWGDYVPLSTGYPREQYHQLKSSMEQILEKFFELLKVASHN